MKIAVILVVIAVTGFDIFLKCLTKSRQKAVIPDNVKDIYDGETYKKRNAYESEKTLLGIIHDILSLIVTVLFLVFDLHSTLFGIAAEKTDNIYLQSYFMLGVFFIVKIVLAVIFDAVETFKTETKYGFNKKTVKTFIGDTVKEAVILAVLFGGLLGLFIALYEAFGIYAFIGFYGAAVILLVSFAFLRHPLSKAFNKFSPLAEGTLRDKITAFAVKIGLPDIKIFVMDASRRSTKLNAYFSGFGKNKVIVLYDTAVQKLTEDEIIAVLAHEAGHAKKKHIILNMALGFIFIGILTALASLVVTVPEISAAFGFADVDIAFGAYIFFVLFAPISLVLSIPTKIFSRRHEFAADAYAKENASAVNLVSALKKLAKENYSNLTPHPLVVFMTYSHPPISERIAALDAGAGT